MKLRLVLAALLFVAVTANTAEAQTTAQGSRQKLSIFTADAAAQAGLVIPPEWNSAEQQSSLAERRVVIYGPSTSCEIEEKSSLQDTPSGLTSRTNVIPFVPAFGQSNWAIPAPTSWLTTMLQGTVGFSNIAYERVHSLMPSSLRDAIMRCKASVGATPSRTRQPVFALEGIVRKVDMSIDMAGGLVYLKRRQYVLLTEDVRFIQAGAITRSTSSDVALSGVVQLAELHGNDQ